MSGHNKWSSIKNKKGKEDAKRGKIFTKLARTIMVAVKEGGVDAEYNASLKTAIEKAKAENMPNDNIQRAIKKAAGEGAGNAFEEIMYEGYGPEGIAMLVLCLTDNKNRTASDVRHAFDKGGGNLGQSGSVSFMFERKGIILIDNENLDETTVMTDAIDAGAEDFSAEDDVFEIKTDMKDFSAVRNELSKKGYKFLKADLSYLPLNESEIKSEENIKKMVKLIDALEDNDDVQEVYHNWEMPEDLEV